MLQDARARWIDLAIIGLGLVAAAIAFKPYLAFMLFEQATSWREFADISTAVQLLDGQRPFQFSGMPVFGYVYGIVNAYTNYILFLVTGVNYPVVRIFTFAYLLTTIYYLVPRGSRTIIHAFSAVAIALAIAVSSIPTIMMTAKPDTLGLLLAYASFFVLRMDRLPRRAQYMFSATLLVLAFFTKIYFCLMSIPLVLYVWYSRSLRDAFELALFGTVAFIVSLTAATIFFEVYPYTSLATAVTLSTFRYIHVWNQLVWIVQQYPFIIGGSAALGLHALFMKARGRAAFFPPDDLFYWASAILGLLEFCFSLGGHHGAFGSYAITLIVVPLVGVVLNSSYRIKGVHLALSLAAAQLIYTVSIVPRNVEARLARSSKDFAELERTIANLGDQTIFGGDVTSLQLWKMKKPICETGHSEFFGYGTGGIRVLSTLFPQSRKVQTILLDYRKQIASRLAQKSFGSIICARHSRMCQIMLDMPEAKANYEKTSELKVEMLITGVSVYDFYTPRP